VKKIGKGLTVDVVKSTDCKVSRHSLNPGSDTRDCSQFKVDRIGVRDYLLPKLLKATPSLTNSTGRRIMPSSR
jgi:hypothetical protein